MWCWLKGSDTERLAAKYGMIVTRGLDEDMVMMPVLWHGDTPVGVLASFVDWHKSRLLFFVSGRDEQFRDLPVGLLLHAHNIRWAIENGIETYDLLRGNEPYRSAPCCGRAREISADTHEVGHEPERRPRPRLRQHRLSSGK